MPCCVLKKCDNNTRNSKKTDGITYHTLTYLSVIFLQIYPSLQWSYYPEHYDGYRRGVGFHAPKKPTRRQYTALEIEHIDALPQKYKSRYIEGTDFWVPHYSETPDYRVPEPPWQAERGDKRYMELNRPYRFSPTPKVYEMEYWKPKFYVRKAACYCTTVFKRLTVLAGCAVLTQRHVLTTATATETVLKLYGMRKTLYNILGVWYETDSETRYNTSVYSTPARIHYHPYYAMPEHVNRSHPLPCNYDLSIWTMTRNIYLFAFLCWRGGASPVNYSSSRPWPWQLVLIVDYQMVWAIGRQPMPWFRYVVATRRPEADILWVCPKTEWGSFFCVQTEPWGSLGVGSGAALHLSNENISPGWERYDGLIGINAFSMRLRSMGMIAYFTVIDRYTVLEFIYSAYKNRIQMRYLDYRFENTVEGSPKLKKDKAKYWIKKDDPIATVVDPTDYWTGGKWKPLNF